MIVCGQTDLLDLIINDQENSETKEFVNHYLNKNGDSFGVIEKI